MSLKICCLLNCITLVLTNTLEPVTGRRSANKSLCLGSLCYVNLKFWNVQTYDIVFRTGIHDIDGDGISLSRIVMCLLRIAPLKWIWSGSISELVCNLIHVPKCPSDHWGLSNYMPGTIYRLRNTSFFLRSIYECFEMRGRVFQLCQSLRF